MIWLYDHAMVVAGCVFTLLGHTAFVEKVYGAELPSALLPHAVWNNENPMEGCYVCLALGRWLTLSKRVLNADENLDSDENIICQVLRQFCSDLDVTAMAKEEAGSVSSWVSLRGHVQLLYSHRTEVLSLGAVALTSLLQFAKNRQQLERDSPVALGRLQCMVWSDHRDVSHHAKEAVEAVRLAGQVLEPPSLLDMCAFFISERYSLFEDSLKSSHVLARHLQNEIVPFYSG